MNAVRLVMQSCVVFLTGVMVVEFLTGPPLETLFLFACSAWLALFLIDQLYPNLRLWQRLRRDLDIR